MNITPAEIDSYLIEVKRAIRNNKYRIERNINRGDNVDLFINYLVDREKEKEILLSLTANDFSQCLPNKHRGYEHEQLYVFGKNVQLLERVGESQKTVPLYIKFNKIGKCYVIIVSLHEQKYPIKYYFK